MRYHRARPKQNTGLLVNEFVHRLATIDSVLIARLTDEPIGLLKIKIYDWCCDSFGKEHNDWTYGLRDKYMVMYFKTKEDAMAFKLRWL